MKKIMIVNTSHTHFDGTDKTTGLWLSELVHFYDEFQNDEISKLTCIILKVGKRH